MTAVLRTVSSSECCYCGEVFAVDYNTMRRLTQCPAHWQHERGRCCADCAGDLLYTQEPWGDRTTCADCGATDFRSIGD